MRRYVADTQCILWYFANDRRLPRAARAAFDTAEKGYAQILIPTIALVEALFLFQRQRVPETVLSQMMALAEDPDASLCIVPLDMVVVRAVSGFGPAAVPELPDRIVAATARALGVPLLTTDSAIAESGLVEVVE
jgi:predicted nucleic acid-binding protein